MQGRWGVVILIAFLLAGCSTVPSKRINSLEAKVSILEIKVDSIEQRQSTIEGSNGESWKSTGYLKGKVDSRGASDVVAAGLKDNGGYFYKPDQKPLTQKDIQLALKNAGFYNGPIDGKIGRNTKKAIKEFQKAKELKADGKVGPKTKSLLLQYFPAERDK